MKRHIAVSALFNIAGRALPALLLLVTTPIYLHLIGVSRYGAMAILWLALGYFGVFDLGLGRAVAQRIARVTVKAPDPFTTIEQQRSKIFWSAMIASLVIASLASGVLFWPLLELMIHRVLHLTPELRVEAEHSIWVLLTFLPIATTLSVLIGTLEGTEHFDLLNLGQLVGLVGYQLLPLTVATLGHITLPWLVGAAMLGRLSGAGVLFWFCEKVLDYPRPQFEWRVLRPLLRYGGWITVSAIVSPILNVTDRFFIGARLGLAYVTHYVVPFNMVMYAGILPQSLAAALFPRYARLGEGEAKAMMWSAIRIIAAGMTPIVILGIWLMHGFLTWWLGATFAAQSALVGELLLLGIWINALAHAPYGLLQAQGQAELTAKFHLLELVVYLPLLWWSIARWGISGAAAVWDGRVFLDLVLLLLATQRIWTPVLSLTPSLLLIVVAFVVNLQHGQISTIGFIIFAAIILLWSLMQAQRFTKGWAAYLRKRLKDGRRVVPSGSSTTDSASLPTVAVLMAVYNGARFLEAQLLSILTQSYAQIRLYIRDDGSTDGSVEILQAMADQNPKEIIFLQDHEKHLGVIGNFHRLLQIADQLGTEPYIMLADQDDVWFADKVEITLLEMLQTERWAGKETPVLVHTDLCVTNDRLQIRDPSFWHYQHLDPSRDDLRQLCMQNMVTGCTVMMNRALLKKALPIPDNVLMHDWWLALTASAFGIIRFIPQATMFYRQHDKNDTGAKRFGLDYVLRAVMRVRSSTTFWQLLARNQRQAEAFLARFHKDLSAVRVNDLQRFSSLSARTPIVERMRAVFIRKFCRHGWIRNIGLIMRLAIG
ncbi:glycosyltransferase [Acidithiobacillus caldus]|uniref:glycosyltransferase n=1 Tax=Acidithiobacillus caldus TaxID=33059 RepID=UPI0006746194|nr:glycosyltransferase [Acidithiobacillus caldus]MBU2761839.1 glycosyltransferase [Acidithiobacillus caldus]MBU2769676.1 glycosyltransferase [Acidithiobacillus caldus]MBU2782038.1 glycosyltransferase [Acidithiobacillus caldus]